MLKTIITLATLAICSVSYSQNIEFKSSNFKDKKEEFKKAEAAISAGDEFFKLGNEAFFMLKNPGLNFQKALNQYEIAQKFNPNCAELNFKIGACHANSTNPNKSIEFIRIGRIGVTSPNSTDMRCNWRLNSTMQ